LRLITDALLMDSYIIVSICPCTGAGTGRAGPGPGDSRTWENCTARPMRRPRVAGVYSVLYPPVIRYRVTCMCRSLRHHDVRSRLSGSQCNWASITCIPLLRRSLRLPPSIHYPSICELLALPPQAAELHAGASLAVHDSVLGRR